MLLVTCSLRENDDFGSGGFSASRGNRKHRGVDFAATPDSILHSPVNGIVSKHGQPYDDTIYKYIEIKDDSGLRHRFFYTMPIVDVGEEVKISYEIAVVQNIAAKFDTKHKKMINHIHYEIKDQDGDFINPIEFLTNNRRAPQLA